MLADTIPTRVTYGDWEPDLESVREVVRLVPVSGDFLTGFTYERRVHDEYRRWRRVVCEYWDTPARREPVLRQIDIASWSDSGRISYENTIDIIDIPATTEARWHYEYKERE